MAGRVAGKVAFITGAARGQGRSHAVRLAEEGADIIAVDICEQIESNPYPLATEEDLAETVAMVEKLDRRIVSRKADVRHRDQLQAAVDAGLAEFGHLDVVVANAGILPMAMGDPHPMDFVDAVDVDLVGVLNAVAVSLPHLEAAGGGSIIMTGSLAAMMPNTVDNPNMGPGSAGYGWAKRILMEYTEQLALQLGPKFIRVNCIHPTNVNTHLLHNDGLYSMFRPDLEHPTREDVEPAFAMMQAIPVPYVEPRDISAAVLFLASDEARYVTGQQLRVDAGGLLKYRSMNNAFLREIAMQRGSESRMLIDGKLVPASDGATYANINPATEEVLGRVADATAGDVDAAIAAARRAFDETDWATNTEFRVRCLRQLQAALESEKEELRAELVAEVGTPVMVTGIAQLEWPLAHDLNYYADLIENYQWERELPDSDLFGVHSARRVWKEAVGVVSAIIPWNFPFEVLLGKLAPALAAGNTIVVKSAIETPFNALRIGRLIAEATDIPAGVVNIVTTSDNTIAERLVRDPRVDMVSFTGSTAVGRHIQQVGADSVKRVFLELGGKSAMVVLDDADLATVIPASAQACMHAGQGCALTTRLLVPRSRYAEAVAIATAVYQHVPYGDPADPQTFSGPLISQKQRERVLAMIEQGKKEGARVAVGGGIPEHLPKGYYVQPTLFVDVDNSMSIAQQEIFGPVLAVIAYDDSKGDAEAVRVANDSPYGLSGAVFSADQERALAVARQLRTGSIGINGGMFYGADAPYGGYKASGVGRQNGIEGLEEYLETKTIAYAAG